MKHVRLILYAVIGAAVTVAATAGETPAIVYDNGVGGAAGIDAAFQSDADTSFRYADDAVLARGAAIAAVEWTGAYGLDNTPPAVDDFTIYIFADDDVDGGPNGAPLFTFPVGDAVARTYSGVSGVFDYYDFTAAVDFDLPPGIVYWIVIVADTAFEADNFFWGGTNAGGDAHLSTDDGANWGATFRAFDFRLRGAPLDDCPTDIAEDDGVIDTFDLLALLASWGTDGTGADIAAPTDIVDTFDLLELLANWGPCE